MDFDYSDEQQLLRDSVERFVREEYDWEARKRVAATADGWSRAHWSLFAELGWLAVPLPEADGGLGGGAVELAILFEQFGRGLVLEPYLATVVLGGGAIDALARAPEHRALLAGVADGSLQLALGLYETGTRWELPAIDCRARQDGEGWVLEGAKCAVLNAPHADQLLIAARQESGRLGVFLAPRGAEGLSMQPYRTVDGGSAAELRFSGLRLPGQARLGGDGDALPALAALADRTALCVCAEAVGAMSVLLQRTVDYTKTRRQFGVPIASFQALQHRMADMFIELEQSRSILLMALLTAEGGGSLARAVSAAKSRIGRAARCIGQEAIQLHGGIGVTDELDVGHYVKRLTAIEALFGNTDWHLRRFGETHD